MSVVETEICQQGNKAMGSALKYEGQTKGERERVRCEALDKEAAGHGKEG